MSAGGTANFGNGINILDDDILALGNTTDFKLYHSSSNHINYIDSSAVADTALYFYGNDGGSGVNALVIDFSAAGAATFSDTVTANSFLQTNSANYQHKFFLANGTTGVGYIYSTGSTFQMDTQASQPMELLVNGAARLTLGTGGSATFNPAAGGHAVFNEGGIDADFRVESDGNANMLFVDGENNKVGIGTNSPGAPLHVQATHTSTDVTAADSNTTLLVGNSGTGNGVYNAIRFSGNQQDMYMMSVNHGTQASRRLGFFVGSVAGDAVADERLSILGDGNVGIGTTAPVDALTLANNTGLAWKMSNSYTHGIFKQTNDLTIRRTSGSGSVAAGDLSLTIAGASGDVTVNTGDLIFGTAGKGIVLGATTNEHNNTLDDYEQGSWTPAISGSGGTADTAYSTQVGGYTKVGNIVTANFHVKFSDEGTLTSTIRISGLPFIGNGGPQYQTAAVVSGLMNIDADQQLVAMQYAGNAFLYLFLQEPQLTLTQVTGNGSFTDTSEIAGSVSYFTNL